MNTKAENSDQQKITTALIILASDIGSIYSIINASDTNSEIFTKSKILHEEANTIGYNAEIGIFDLEKIKKMVAHLSNLAGTIYKKREINPLISDELISALKKAMIDAENVLKLTTAISS